MNMNDYKKVIDRIAPSEECREEVMNMRNEYNRKKIKHKSAGKVAAAVTAALIAACGGTAATAAKLGAFERLSSKTARTVTNDHGDEFPIDKFDKNDYASIAPAAVEAENTEPCKNDDITVSIDSVYCDGHEMIFALNGSLNNGNSIGAGYIACRAYLYIDGNMIYNPDNSYGCYGGSFVIDEGEDNSFTGSVTCMLTGNYQIDDTVDVELKLTGIQCREQYWTDSLLDTDPITLTTTVTPDLSLIRNFGENGLTVEEDGFSATIYRITPAMMVVGYEYPQWYDDNDETITWYEPGYEETGVTGPKYAIIGQFFDADENLIENLQIDPLSMGNGKTAGCLRSTDSDVVYCRFYNKQTQGTGEMELIKELRIDLAE
ncbi:MAG: hypothetical protein J6P14_00275 [Ruminococcus sp.]|nr:hypothetical protein [Ruminococcus sp.]